MRIRTLITGCAVLSVTTAAHAHAQGWVEAQGVVRERSTVSVRVHDQVAAVEVEEWFRNRGAGLGEGDYMFPLPAGAVFASYSLFQGDKELRGEMLDATQARRVYEKIVRRKKDPALIELVGHGLVRARVFPIAAGESRRVVLRYTQPLQRAGDALEFRYPARAADGATLRLAVTVENARAYRNAVSPTHQLSVQRARGQMIVQPNGSLRSDFAMLLPLAERDVGISMSTHGNGSDDGFFMLRLTPGEVSQAARVPRDITVVLDVSGSMSGEKIEQAKAAMRQLLGTLGTSDRFRLIKFSGASTEWRDGWTSATNTDIRAANRWVDDLRADGGTNVGEALTDAFREQSPSSRLSVVVFLTDGLPSVGEQNPERIAAIAEHNAGHTRVFAFGVGHDVNTYLLDRLGAAGRGSAQYVQPGESVETALGTLSAKIRYPVLTDLALSASGVSLREVYPTTLPDLFAGEDLVVFGRYRMNDRFARGGPSVEDHRNVNGVVTINGARAGKGERYTTRVTFSSDDDGNDYMPRLWASRKLGELTRRVRLEGNNPELIAEIKSTAMRYGLLSEYTSYFVTEPSAPRPDFADDQVARRGVAGGKADRNRPPSTQAASTSPSYSPLVPRDVSGSAAVASAESSRKQREVASAGEVDAFEKAAAQRLLNATSGRRDGKEGGRVTATGPDATAAQPRVVAGRTFVLHNGVWMDAAIGSGTKTLDILAYSDAYFALLRALPELRAYVGLGEVALAGANVTIRIVVTPHTDPNVEIDAGIIKGKLSDAKIAEIVKQFRGAASTS